MLKRHEAQIDGIAGELGCKRNFPPLNKENGKRKLFKLFDTVIEIRNPRYPHFDSLDSNRVLKKNFRRIISEVRKSGKLAHSFYPLIKINKTEVKRKDAKIKWKERPIMLTARLDSNIYAYYRSILQKQYEEKLKTFGLHDVVIAYRKIPIEPENYKGRAKCNIHFAHEAFLEIKRRLKMEEKVIAIALDIKGFFDNLNHTIIKASWCKLLDIDRIPEDHYTIFKNITNFCFIESENIERELKEPFFSRKVKRKQIYPSELRGKLKKYLITNKVCCKRRDAVNAEKGDPYPFDEVRGIPQGTRISDIIANMYMIDFDMHLHNFARENNCYYRRYSDDILIICDPSTEEVMQKKIKDEIQLVKLVINDAKTLISKFEPNSIVKSYNNQGMEVNKSFEYLGLSFDGEDIRIKVNTISRCFRKLNNGIKKELFIAKDKYKTLEISEIYKKIAFSKIYKRYLKAYKKSTFYNYINNSTSITGSGKCINQYKSEKLIHYIKKRAMKFLGSARIVKENIQK